MRIAVFDTHPYDERALSEANASGAHQLEFFEERLHDKTVELAAGFDAVCPFVNCRLTEHVLQRLAELGVRLVALRAAGFNGIDIAAAERAGIVVARVPAYSPEAVAEHAFALLLTLVRKTHRAYNRVREQNFSLDNLEGFTLHGKTYGSLGAGRIGQCAMRIAKGFGCKLIAYDPYENPAIAAEIGFEYASLERVLAEADVISLHLPLTEQSHHIINAAALAQTRRGVILINTSRGGLIDTPALIEALKSGQVGGVGLDVYEMEEGVFFHDLSDRPLQDDQLARLMTFPNVLITSHQGFLTREALNAIAQTTLASASAFERGAEVINRVRLG
ncbi:2-hydroxyacid dehydrogenase [Uliginosibacterium sp. TH139]|uniref:2-hydroxyacid dehydrogenase n=1 Tax=Uliginosibacterium sp. TH139 TaxID=2067453 RepID=UPI000C7A64C7|nr:2-hydroxyacid dehydrogenase [Uliginosibacterium sp. TH139]PLK49369.1 hydroxyacid dehydrogenase [Uliginosibacterium sp. TH139]